MTLQPDYQELSCDCAQFRAVIPLKRLYVRIYDGSNGWWYTVHKVALVFVGFGWQTFDLTKRGYRRTSPSGTLSSNSATLSG